MNGPQTHAVPSKADTSSLFKSSLRHQRDKASRCLRHLAIPQVTLGFLATGAGIVTILIAAVKPNFPFYLGADIWTGVVCITAGGVAYRVHAETNSGKVSNKTHTLMMTYGVLTLICMSLSVLSLALSAYVLFTCTDDDKPKAHCLARKRAKLGLAVVNVVVECFIVVTSLLCFWKFSYHRSSFHVQSDKTSTKRSEQKPEKAKQSQDVYIARCPSSQAHTYSHHVCVHCKPTSCRNAMFMPSGLPPPYTRVAPY